MIRLDEAPMPWWNETVMALVAGILAGQAWDRLPILADAMEDAGCEDTNLLYSLRNDDWINNRKPKATLWLDRLIAGVITVDQLEKAVDWFDTWITEFAGDDGRTEAERDKQTATEWFIDVLDGYVLSDGDGRFVTYGYQTDVPLKPMWEHYETLTGHPASQMVDSWEHEGQTHTWPKQPFGCSC